VPAPEAKVEAKPEELVPVETPVTQVPEAPPESAVADAIADAVADAVAYGFADAHAETAGASQPVAAKSSGTAVPEQGSSGSGGGAGSGAGTGIGTHAGAGADGPGPATRASPATLVFGPKPEYPASSILRGEVGTVLCTIQIGADGRVTDVAITRSSGHERLDRSAVDALRRWIFEPAKADDRAIPSRFVHQVVFRLD
jgi:protein TonB